MRKVKYFLIIMLICFGWIHNKAFAENLLPSQSSFPGQQAEYGLLLSNSDAKAHAYTIQIKNLPDNFGKTCYLGKQIIDRIKLQPTQSADLTLKIAVPMQAKQSDYRFQAVVVRDDNLETALPLNLKVDNSYLLKIVSSSIDLSGFSGKEIIFPVTVSNVGQKALKEIQLNLELPYKWQAVITPQKIIRLNAGESASYRVQVTIPPTQDAGNQKISVAANADFAMAGPVTIPIQVQKSASYLIFPVSAVVLIFIGAALYFKKQGRR